MTDLFANRVGEDRVATVLRLLSAPPRRRGSAGEGDLPGDFDFWFDGGAGKQHTGSVEYLLADGTTASVAAPAARLWVRIAFPDGEVVSVAQGRDTAPDRPATANLYARPRNWFCIFCGWKCDESCNDYFCKQCQQLRPFVGGSATVRQCQECKGVSLAVARYCEWCGASVGVTGTAGRPGSPADGAE